VLCCHFVRGQILGYETDLSDQQWALIERLIPLAKIGGRPRKTDVRRVVDSLLYLLKTGCHWRLLPADFPHWRTVYEYFKNWRDDGTLRQIQKSLYFAARKKAGRSKYPSVVIVDSQSVKTSKMGGERGFDGGKWVKGRKRHLVVDSLGLPLTFSVTAANVHDLSGGRYALNRASKFLGGRSLKKIYADGAYAAQSFRDWVEQKFDAVVRISKNLAQRFKEFIPVSQRWVIERTFAWWYDYRRLTIDYERLTLSSRAMLRLAAINIMLNRLAPRPEVGWI
jgi:putative transposase